MDPTTIYVLLILFLATLIRSTFGFGEALIAVPLLALRIPIIIAAPLAVLVSVLVALIIVIQDYKKIQIKSALALVLSSAFGIPLGLLLIAKANDHTVKIILGSLIALFSLYSLLFNRKLHLKKDHPAWLLTSGFISGILGGAYGMNGPPLAIYGSLRRWSPQHFRATLQGYFLPASLIGLLGYLAIGLWNPLITTYFLYSLPAILLAILLGRSLNHRLQGDSFFKFIYLTLIALGLLLITQSIL